MDAQYFSVAMLPDAKSTAGNMERAVGTADGRRRGTAQDADQYLLPPDQQADAAGGRQETSPRQRYEVFAGPKRPQLLAKYDLSGLICYGWPIFQWVAVPMTYILDFFYGIVHNYGLAIIMLTIVVRLAFFPVSRKQAQSAQLMQKIQPKLKELEKKHKGDWKALQQARQELLAKYNYNPSSGCVLLFLQLPVFIGLVSGLAGQRRAARRALDHARHSLVLQPGRAGHALRLELVHARRREQRRGLPLVSPIRLDAGDGALLEPVPHHHAGAVPGPAEGDDAAGGRRAGGPATEDHEVRHVLDGLHVLQGGGRAVHLLHMPRRFGDWPRGGSLPQAASRQDGDSGDDGVPSRPVPKPDRLSNAEREAIRRKKRGKK